LNTDPLIDLSVERSAGNRFSASNTCLFIINGLGLGNSTRCYAVMEALADSGCSLHVLTSGNGLAFFQNKPFVQSLTPMEAFFYSGSSGGISGWATLKSLRSLGSIAKSKRKQLDRLLDQLQPDVAVIDSEYAIAPLRRRGIPVIALNTSEMIVTEYLKRRPAPGTLSHFWFIEYTDYLFHKHFCDLVLSPFPLQTPTRNRRFRRVGLVVRSTVRTWVPRNSELGFSPPRQIRKVVFMLSGSVHASRIHFEQYQLPFQVEVVGRPGESRNNLTYHGRRMDNEALLAAADVLVINGGYSAVSEAFALRKPVFVIPVPGHAEQYVNACLVSDLGLGFMATEHDVLPQLLNMYRQNEWTGLKQMPTAFEINGAEQAAEMIIAMAERQRKVNGKPYN
jgi:UDP:flavonoid glycosyltransferase YjiC (YdhE family)